MTDEELQGIAVQAVNIARREIERGEFNFLFASYFVTDTPPLHRMTKVEQSIIEHLGEDWLNSGHTKDIGFHLLRACVTALPPDAVVIATAANGFAVTEKFRALPAAERRHWMSNHDRNHEAVGKGLMTVKDVVHAYVQTAERVGQYVVLTDGSEPPQWHCAPQAAFNGRLKMYVPKKRGRA